MKNWNSAIKLMATLIYFYSASLFADYCVVGEDGEVVGCSVLIYSGDPMQPTVAVVAKEQNGLREWELGIRILMEGWIQINGDSEIRIDDGGFQVLVHRVSRKAEVKEGLVSESAHFLISEDMVEAMAKANDQVLFKITAENSDPVEITVGSDRLVELGVLLSEARAKI